MIVDAAFLKRSERLPFAELAEARGCSFLVIDCRAPLALLHERIRRRQMQGGDPSEADGRVLDLLSAHDEALDEDEQRLAWLVDAAVEGRNDAGTSRWDTLARRWQTGDP